MTQTNEVNRVSRTLEQPPSLKFRRAGDMMNADTPELLRMSRSLEQVDPEAAEAVARRGVCPMLVARCR